MNKYTEQQIKEKLKTLASIEPSAESVGHMDRNIRRIISDAGRRSSIRSFFYYAAASAAMLLMGISLLYDFNPVQIPPTTGLYAQDEPRLTLAKLNTVFQSGGHKALDDYFEMVESHRQPRAETITLQQIMKEL